jgi:hypothetical protein
MATNTDTHGSVRGWSVLVCVGPWLATEGQAADQAAILLTPAHVLVSTTGGGLVLVKRSPASAKAEEAMRLT